MRPLAADSTVSPAATGARRELVRAQASGPISAFESWSDDARAFSPADPDTLARAVRAHKAGDAFAQAALTLALMLAIGAVAFVLTSTRASAAGFLAESVASHAAAVSVLAVVGGMLLVATRLTLRRAKVRVRSRR